MPTSVSASDSTSNPKKEKKKPQLSCDISHSAQVLPGQDKTTQQFIVLNGLLERRRLRASPSPLIHSSRHWPYVKQSAEKWCTRSKRDPPSVRRSSINAQSQGFILIELLQRPLTAPIQGGKRRKRNEKRKKPRRRSLIWDFRYLPLETLGLFCRVEFAADTVPKGLLQNSKKSCICI